MRIIIIHYGSIIILSLFYCRDHLITYVVINISYVTLHTLTYITLTYFTLLNPTLPHSFLFYFTLATLPCLASRMTLSPPLLTPSSLCTEKLPHLFNSICRGCQVVYIVFEYIVYAYIAYICKK